MSDKSIIFIRNFQEQKYIQLKNYFWEQLGNEYNQQEQRVVDLNKEDYQYLIGYEVNSDQVEEIAHFIKKLIINTFPNLISFEEYVQMGILSKFVHAKLSDKLQMNSLIQYSKCNSSQKMNDEEIQLNYKTSTQSFIGINRIKSKFKEQVSIDDKSFVLIFTNHEVPCEEDLFNPSSSEELNKQVPPQKKSNQNRLIYQSQIDSQSMFQKLSIQQLEQKMPSLHRLQDQIKNSENGTAQLNKNGSKNEQNSSKQQDQNVQSKQSSECIIYSAQNILHAQITHSDEEEEEGSYSFESKKFKSHEQVFKRTQTKNLPSEKKLRKAQSLHNLEQKPQKRQNIQQSYQQKESQNNTFNLTPDQKQFVNILLNFVFFMVIYKIIVR